MFSVRVLSMKVSLVVLVLVTITEKVSSENIVSDKLNLGIESPPLAQPDTVRQKRQFGPKFGEYDFQRVEISPNYQQGYQGQGYQNNFPGYQGNQVQVVKDIQVVKEIRPEVFPNSFNDYSNSNRGFGDGYQNYGRG